MAKLGKRMREALEKVEVLKEYELMEAVALVKETARAKFDESVDVAVRLGVDSRKADQNIRGSVLLPRGTGKKFRILVFAKGEKEAEAREAGAEFVGGEDLMKKIQGGWLEFDRVVATPDMMGVVGRLGKVLGPRGMMPNPKTGTVGPNVTQMITDLKKGKTAFKNDDTANIHQIVGKVSFDNQKLQENIETFLETLKKIKPNSTKGTYIKTMYLTSSMGPSVKFDA